MFCLLSVGRFYDISLAQKRRDFIIIHSSAVISERLDLSMKLDDDPIRQD